jgi:hypothetical protein
VCRQIYFVIHTSQAGLQHIAANTDWGAFQETSEGF